MAIDQFQKIEERKSSFLDRFYARKFETGTIGRLLLSSVLFCEEFLLLIFNRKKFGQTMLIKRSIDLCGTIFAFKNQIF